MSETYSAGSVDDLDDLHTDDRAHVPNRLQSKTPMFVLVFLLMCLTAVGAVYFTQPEPIVAKEDRLAPTISEVVPQFSVPAKAPVPKPEPVIIREPVLQPAKIEYRKIIDERVNTIREPVADPSLARRLSPSLGSAKTTQQGSGQAPVAPMYTAQGIKPNIDLSVTKTAVVSASRLPDLTYLVPKGTPIGCVLNVAIQSDQPGLLTCTLTDDVYGADGTTVLLDRGSVATGEYRTASLTTGKDRIFAIWDRIRAPDGAVINLDSPSGDALGRAGIGGYIDNHYFERFGSAILISMIDDAFGEPDGSTRNTEEAFDDALQDIVEQFTRIQPTLHKNQGGLITIIAARDLDMSSAYEVSHVSR